MCISRLNKDKLPEILAFCGLGLIITLFVSGTGLFCYELYKRGDLLSVSNPRINNVGRSLRTLNTDSGDVHWILNYLDANCGVVISYAALLGGSVYLSGYPRTGACLAITIGSIGILGSLFANYR